MMGRRNDIQLKVYEKVIIERGMLDTPCHIWQGPTSGSKGRGKNYPRMYLDGQTVAVHKVMWTNEHGYIPGKKTLDHLCRNRLCINHAHLELVTNKENNRRRAKAAKEQKNHVTITCFEITPR